ncbi:glycosyltransferase [Pseudomonas guariconensis]|uniref:glycosyltransferase n=1 Tax=Pseudomonas guariconensis TaxID=1288410 RepID=UPI0025A98490|nr:glycosyltransferase [Pseudomonas guariconensis]MDM9593115.1 glycosyltransferase [Pseudomonas guariconensis]MDM9605942.1 glycosyltransferase [Pseudomonas guariconensis]MDM9610899.1 glycosyltransferase [Pseudomonas guariconensis]
MNAHPDVSIVIPAFNPRFFAMALQSALAQTYERLEILVCDDSEGEEIEAIVRTFDGVGIALVRYMRNDERLGFVGNLLKAMEMASGELLKVLCDDDRLFPLCIERQAAVLQEHADVSLVLAQRLFCDADNTLLPMRLSNARFVNVDKLYKGDDMVSFQEGHSFSFLGNFSAALMRRQQALELLRTLTQDNQGFQALLDQALFTCLMRRGDLVMLANVLVVERLHPGRLSKCPAFVQAARVEWGWLQQMVKARGGEAAPAKGWVRQISLLRAGETPRAWRETNLQLTLSNWQTCMQGRVGSESESYAEFYQQWLQARRFSEARRRHLPALLAAWPSQPRIVVLVLDPEGDRAAVQATLDSLAGQIYASHSYRVMSARAGHRAGHLALEPDWVSQLNREVATLAEDDWVYLLRAGDRLSESALLILAERIALFPSLACLYSDEATWHEGKSQEPVFKPDFNIDLFRSYPYVGRALAFACSALRAQDGFDPAFADLAPHDMIWRLMETSGPQVIGHITEVQVQSTFSYAQWMSSVTVLEQNGPVLQAHLNRLGIEHQLHQGALPLLNRVQYLHAEQPLVSIIVTCCDDLGSLQQCVQSVIEQTTYPRYEVLVVAGGEVDPDTATWLAAMADIGGGILRVLRLPLRGDDSALFDRAARQAAGEYLLKLSPTLCVTQPDWLDEMLQHAQRPEVGVVGAKIIDRFDQVVDGGWVLGVGQAAGPAFVGEGIHARGYLQRLQCVQNWSAVSGDCLLVRTALWESLGGLGSQQFSAGLCELDLCLRATGDGYLVVWTPYVHLRVIGSGGAPQGQAKADGEVQRFVDQWLPRLIQDPAYNPNLNLTIANFAVEPIISGSWSPLCARLVPSVLCLPINASAVGHYRVIQPFIELEGAGKVIGHVAHETPHTVQLARMNPDVIVLQLRHTAGTASDIERIGRISSARRVFEVDDYVLAAPSKNSHARNKPADIEQHLRRSIGLCDRVVVTTDALANALSSMHKDIRVVPNTLVPHLWTGLQSRRRTSSKPRVGWGGGTSHTGDLEVIAEVVRELAGQVEWVFFGMCPEGLRHYVHEFHPVVGLLDYPRKLASLNLDLALAPLEHHIFNDCKSNLRLLEYGACRYPVVCSDTEAYRGDLPCTRVRSNSTDEWLQAIRMHLNDPVASYKMGDELHERVMRDYVLRGDALKAWEWGWLAD